MENKINFLCIHQGYELYGSDRTFLQSLDAINQKYTDSNISVVLPKHGPLYDHVTKYSNNILIVPSFILRRSKLPLLVKNIFHLHHYIKKAISLLSEFDFIYINTVVLLDYILSLPFLKQADKVLHIHEIPTGIERLIFSIIVSLSGAPVIFNSKATANAFFLPPWQKKYVIYNAVSFKGKKDIDCNRDDLRVLMIGRITWWKGQHVLLESLKNFQESERAKVKVRIVGDVFENKISYKRELENLILEHNFASFVEIEPFVDDPSALYDWADVVVVPSVKPEPFGLVAVEAMSHGRPVVGSSHGGLVEIISNKKTGFLFKPGDSKELFSCLRFYLYNKDVVIQHGAMAYERYKLCFDENHYIREIGEVIEKIRSQ